MKNPMTFKKMLDEYLSYRKECGLATYPTVQLVVFYHHTIRKWPEDSYLTQQMVDWWAQKREGENTWNSTRSRVFPLIAFIKWTNSRGWTSLSVPTLPPPVKSSFVPHAFTQAEICNLLKSCNEYYARKRDSKSFHMIKLEFPVMILLMYSSGMRTTEVRLLRTEDVNLSTGVVRIRHTKGYGEHTIVLHDSALEMLRAYDMKIECFIPNRSVFFPTEQDTCRDRTTLTYHWRKLWKIKNEGSTRPYDLRHGYATANIMSWDTGGSISDKLVALSKSMGHSTIVSTLYYFSLVPGYANKIEKLLGEDFKNIIPKFPQDEE
jgi:integrase